MTDVKGPRPLRDARSAPLTSAIREQISIYRRLQSAAAEYQKKENVS
jgi:hypothetical protein